MKRVFLLLLVPLFTFSQDNNYSMSFNGISQYVSFDNMNLPTGDNNRTVAFWVMPTGNSQNDDGGNIFSYGLGCSSCNNQRFSIQNEQVKDETIMITESWKNELESMPFISK